jgi:hypothetical protein
LPSRGFLIFSQVRAQVREQDWQLEAALLLRVLALVRAVRPPVSMAALLPVRPV